MIQADAEQQQGDECVDDQHSGQWCQTHNARWHFTDEKCEATDAGEIVARLHSWAEGLEGSRLDGMAREAISLIERQTTELGKAKALAQIEAEQALVWKATAREAQAEIERLRARAANAEETVLGQYKEIERLREALGKIASWECLSCSESARAALAGSHKP